jgi:hypothetical protein
MEVEIPEGPVSRDGCGVKAEYQGKRLTILLSDGAFQLVDTHPVQDSVTQVRNYENAWIYHLCDAYERHMTTATSVAIGLMSNREIHGEECKYCGLRIPAGLIGQWKMLNWQHAGEIAAWDFSEE